MKKEKSTTSFPKLRAGEVVKFRGDATSDDVAQDMRNMAYFGCNDPYIKEIYNKYLAPREGEDPEDIARSIFDYAYGVASFYPDPERKQYIRSAKRTLKDGLANCVDYSVLISTLLILAGISHSIRRVGFDWPKRYLHVYIILDDGTVMDAIQGQRQDGKEYLHRKRKRGMFGVQQPYLYKNDLKVL